MRQRHSVYHELMTEDRILPPLLNVIQRPMKDTTKWLRVALLRPAQYSSDADIYDEERHYIKATLE